VGCSMRLKLIVGIGFGMILLATAIAAGKLQVANPLTTTQGVDEKIPVAVTQLPLDNGVIPVELRCHATHRDAADELRTLACVVKNNANKRIIALALEYTALIRRPDGGESSDSGFLTQDALIDPSLRESEAHKFIPLGGERTIQRAEPLGHENASVKRIEVVVDYVEFEDHTVAGPDVKGSKLIAQVREGAARYKGWLKRKYTELGGSVSAVLPLLQNTSGLPAELNLDEAMLAVGAEAYRKKVRDLYHSRGSRELKKHLK
jgi:hypothetical protein